jgi:hypothetical protein
MGTSLERELNKNTGVRGYWDSSSVVSWDEAKIACFSVSARRPEEAKQSQSYRLQQLRYFTESRLDAL